jgi:hypothetical protein
VVDLVESNTKLRKAIEAMLDELDHIITASEGTPQPLLLEINRRARRAEQIGVVAAGAGPARLTNDGNHSTT